MIQPTVRSMHAFLGSKFLCKRPSAAGCTVLTNYSNARFFNRKSLYRGSRNDFLWVIFKDPGGFIGYFICNQEHASNRRLRPEILPKYIASERVTNNPRLRWSGNTTDFLIDSRRKKYISLL